MKRILGFIFAIFISSLTTQLLAEHGIDQQSKNAGTDSPFRKTGHLVYISGQGAGSMTTHTEEESRAQITEAFQKLEDVVAQAGGSSADIIKINVYLADLTSDYHLVNEITPSYFKAPYPARSTVGVKNLPLDHRVEIDAVMIEKKE